MKLQPLFLSGLILLPLCSFAKTTEFSGGMNRSVFVGIGGSYNTVSMNETDELVGISKVYNNGVQAAYGNAVGPSTPLNLTQNTFAPILQLGVVTPFKENGLLGLKLIYSYYGISLGANDLSAPQAGTFVTTDDSGSTFTGHATIGSMQTTVNHEIGFIPFIGYKIEKTYVYFGIGPAVFNVESNIYDVTGYANVNGTHSDITGNPTNFSSSDWVWGGDAQIGAMYSLAADWFVDVNYSYIIIPPHDTNYSAPFSSTSSGYLTTGTMNGSTTQRFTLGTFAVSINRSFG